MTPAVAVIRGGGSALVLAEDERGLPHVLHWGADLPDAAAADLVRLTGRPVAARTSSTCRGRSACCPTSGEGWLGTPAYAAHRAGGRTAPRWVADPARVVTARREVRATASDVGVEVVLRYRLDEHGVLVVETALTNTSDDATPARRRRAARRAAAAGPRRRGARPHRALVPRAFAAASAARPTAPGCAPAAAAAPATTRRCSWWPARRASASGRARSGPPTSRGAATTSTSSSGSPRGPARTPPCSAAARRSRPARCGWRRARPTPRHRSSSCHSTEGLDGLTRALVRHQRAAPGYRSGPRPLVLNTWEAVYFDHRPRPPARGSPTPPRRSASSGSCSTTAGSAAAATTTRAWATGRSRPTCGPTGLGPLVDHVKGLGMEFGLWFEPEMVNLDSDLVRAHPEWVLGPVAGVPLPSRHQHVLDLANPEAFDHVLERDERAGRPSTASTSSSGTTTATCTRRCAPTRRAPTGPPCTPRRSRPTGCSTSCAPGTPTSRSSRAPAAGRGSTSACSPAPTGSGPPTATTRSSGSPSSAGPGCSCRRSGWARTSARRAAHTTHRDLDLSLRMLVALGGHAGLEWDITTCTPGRARGAAAVVRALPRAAAAAARRRRRALRPPGRRRCGSVGSSPRTGRMPSSPWSRRSPAAGSPPAPCRCPGSIRAVATGCGCGPRRACRPPCRRRPRRGGTTPTGEGIVASGAALGRVGLALPVLAPAQGFLLHLETATD